MKAAKHQEAMVHRLSDNGRHAVQLLVVPDNGWAESIELTPAQAHRLARHLERAASRDQEDRKDV
jgi:hypothetical protein